MSLKLRFIPIIAIFLLFSHLSYGQLAIESVDIQNVSCFGGDDGQITITVSGAEPPIQYNWIKLSGDIILDGASSTEATFTFPNIIPIRAGTYLIRVRDNTGIELTEIHFVAEPAPLQVSISPDPAISCSGSPMQLNGNPVGGTPPYNHEWTGPGAAFLDLDDIENPLFTNAVGGDYEITYTVTDDNGCVATQTITITNTSNPNTDAGTDDDTCGLQYTLNAVESFGTGSWSASGPGNAVFSDPSSSTATATVDLPGVYTFTWTEVNNGCSDSDNVLITFHETPDFTVVLTNPSSPGGSDGSIQINMTAGIADYTYKLTDSGSNETTFGPTANNSHTFSSLSQDTYNIEVTDGNGCVVSQNRALSDTPVLSVNLSSTQTCGGSSNGSIDIEILAGDNPFDVVVSTVPGGVTVFSVTGTNDFNYLIENLASGNYNVYIEDSFGNVEDTDIAVAEGPFASISYAGSPFCGSGTASVSLVGTVGGTFSASPAGLVINAASGELDLTNSVNGTYTVSYEYGSGSCITTATTQVVLGELAAVSISYDNDPYCQETGGVAPVNITGQVLNSATATYTAGNLPTDFGFRTVSDDSDCPGFLTVNIPVGAVITAVDVEYNMTALVGHYRSDQRSQLRAVSPGGEAESAVYVGSGNIPGTQPYSRTGLTIANNIVGGGSIDFELHSGRTFVNVPACSASGIRVDNNSWKVTVHYSSGHIFTADDPGLIIDQVTGEVDLENSLPGTYTVSYNYTEGACSGLATTTVTVLEKPVVPVLSDVNVCFTGAEQSVVATPPAGGTVIWYTTETGDVVTTAPAGTDPGVYSAWAASELNGCESDRVEATLTIVESPNIPVPVNVNVCSDGTEYTASATVDPGVNLLWYTQEFGGVLTTAPTATNPGVYTAWAAAELNGCESARVEVTLTITDSPAAPAANDVEVCFDGTEYSATATPAAGTSVVYYTTESGSTTTTAPTATIAGVYTAWAASDAGGGCESVRVLVTLTINPLPEATISFGGGTFCAEGTIQATIISTDVIVSGAFSSTPEVGLEFTDVNLGIIDLSLSDPGIYLVEYRFFDDKGCFNVAATTITIEATPAAPIANDLEVCFDGTEYSASATPSAGATIAWYTTESGSVTTTAPTATAAGTYTAWAASVLAGSSCESDRVEVTLIINSQPAVPVANNVNACFDGSEFTATATAPAGATVVWYANETGINPGAQPTATDPGTYTAWAASVDDITGCESDRVLVTLEIYELDAVTIQYDQPEYCQETGGTTSVTINGELLSSASATYTSGNISSDYFFRTVSDNSACPGTLSVTIPIGSVITAVDVQYNMTATLGHYMSDQHSQLRCVSPGGVAEEFVTIGMGLSPGTYSYNRADLTIANGVVGGGTVNFELHAGRTFINSPRCNNTWNRVDNNTWTVTVYYTAGHSFVSNPPGLALDAVTGEIDLENSLPGTYNVVYNYSDGSCNGSTSATVTILDQPDAPVVSDLDVCADGTVQSIVAIAPAGASVVWYQDESSGVIVSAPSSADPGVYTAWAASVDNVTGCESDRVQATLTISDSPAAPTPNNITACFDGSVYTATATAPAGATVIYYTTELGGVVTTAPSASAVGTYTAWAASEQDGCESTRVEVTLVIDDVPAAPTANNVTECFTGSPIAASATVPAGSSLVWYDAPTGGSSVSAPSATAPGTYTAWAASVDDVSGCESARTEVTLIIHPLPQGTITYGATNFCPEGTITPTLTNNVPITFTAFAVTPDDGTLDLDEDTGEINLATSSPGSYLIEYRFMDENGCLNVATTNITIDAVPDVPVANDVTVCFDGTEYSASATAPAGASIVWYTTEFGAVTTTAPTATATGTYTAWAASEGNTSGCESARVEVTLTINPLPAAPTANDVVTCFDGTEYTATATAPAGTSIIYYTTETGSVTTTAPTATVVGVYTAWAASIDDITACESERTLVTLTINELPAAPTPNNITACFDGSVYTATATAPAGATVIYYTTELGGVVTTAPSASAVGTYTAWAASEQDGCESTRVEVTLVIDDVPAAPTANNVTECFTGSPIAASATVPAGSSLVWYDAPTGGSSVSAPSATAPGTYTAWAASVDDVSGCESARTEVTLIIHPLPQGTITYGATNFCPEGTITPTLTNNVPITFTAFAVTPDDGTLDLDEDTGEINLATSSPGSYLIEYRFMDENGCLNVATTNITIDAVPDVPVANDVTVCFDGTEYSASATAPAGASIVWYTTEFGAVTTTAPTATATGTYTAWAASEGNTSGCESARVEVTLTINPLPAAPTANDVVTCFDGTEYTATATAPAGTSIIYYTTETGSVTTTAPTATVVGVYTAWAASIDDITACESERTLVTLTINELPAAPTPNNITACFDGSVYTATATAPAGATVIYYTTELGGVVTTAPSASAVGTYTAWAASEQDGCESTRVEVTLVIDDVPAAPTANNVTECFTGSPIAASATVPAGSSLVWYDAPTGGSSVSAPSATAPGTYTAWAASVDDVSGCESARTEVTLIIHPLPQGTITYGGTNFCPEGTITPTLTNNVPITFTAFAVTPDDGTLDLDEDTGEINLATSSPGSYLIEYRFMDENGCLNVATTNITIDAVPDVPVANDVTVCFDGTEYSASATAPAGASIVWYTTEFGAVTTTAPTATATGTYTAWAASEGNTSGCESARVEVTLTINPLPAAPTANDVVTCFDGTEYTATATAPAGTSIIYYTTETGSVTTTAPTATVVGVYTAWAASIDDITACESERTLVTLTINELPAAPTPNNITACFDGSVYTATATAPAGATVIYYTTELGGVVTTAPSASAVGTYTAWAASEQDGCESTRVEVTLVIDDVPAAPTANNVTECFTGSPIAASATVPAGSSLVWYDAPTGGSSVSAPSATAPGTYTAWAASVDDVSGCESARTEVTLIIHPLPQGTITYGGTNFCPVGTIMPTLTNNVTIVFTGFAVDPPVGLDIDIDTGEINLAVSVPGDYLVEYRFMDENGCLNVATTNITIDAVPDVPVANDVTVCFDGTEYSASATAPAGASIVWYTTEFGAVTTIAPTATAAGTYSAWAASLGNTSGCESARVEVTLTINPLPAAPTANDVVTCFDGTEYTATATAPAGTSIIYYTTETGSVTTTAPTATAVGVYTAWAASIDDITACESERTLVTLTINELPAAPTPNNITACFDGSVYTATATAPAGATVIYYTTELGGVVTTAPSASAVGTYTAWAASEQDGCESTRVEVTLVIDDVPAAPTANNVTECFTGSPIAASATVPAGSSLVWYDAPTGGSSVSAPSATAPGTYTAWAASVDDVSGCESARTEVTLIIHPLPQGTITYGGTNFCPVGTIMPTLTNNVTIVFTGFAVDPPVGLDIDIDTGEINLAGSVPGDYLVEYRFMDENGCLNVATTNITIDALPDVPVANDVTVCFDGTEYSASATAPAGASIVWYTTEFGAVTTTAPTATAAGTYSAWAASLGNTSGCESARVEVTLTINPLPAAPTANDLEVCFDGTEYTATATAPAGTSIIYYTTETGSVTTTAPTATAVGVYTAWAASIDDITACESERTLVTLTINELPAAPTPNNITACFDGSVYTATASAPAGATVIYYTTELGGVVTTAPSASAVGTYTAWAASADDVTSCESTRVEVTLVINELPDAPTANDVTICFDGTEYTASATAPAGSSIVWYDAETGGSTSSAPSATAPGTYTAWAASVDDVTGCESTRTEVTLIIHPLPEGTISYGATNFCPVGTILPTLTNNVTIIFTGFAVDPPVGLDIDIDTGEINLAGSVPGDYMVQYRFMDENNCLNVASTTITINDQPTLTVVSATDALCADETTGTGTITVVASSGDAPFTYELLDSDLNVIDVITTDSDLEQTFTGLLTGTYYVSVADDNSCESAISDAILIDEPDPIAVDPLSVNLFDVTCNGVDDGIISLTANGGSGMLEYSLVLDGIVIAGPQAGNAYFANLEPGAYTISIVDEAGCSILSDEYTIVEPTEILLSAAANPDIVCESDEATIETSVSQGTGPYSFTLWLEGAQVSGPVAAVEGETVLFENIAVSGTYTVMVTDANSCEETLDVIISDPLLIVAYNVDVVGGNSYCEDGSGVEIILDGSETGINYQLFLDGAAQGSPVAGTGSAISFGLQTAEGNYTVTATHESLGCTADMTGSVDVVISPLPLVFDVTGGGDICEGDAGVEIGLNGSETGVDYLLYLDGADTGVSVAGTDNSLSFGSFDQPGVYSVIAINQGSLCEAPMNGTVTITIQPLPTVYNVTGGGSFCQGESGVEVGLDDSDSGIEYQLIINGIDAGAPVAGVDGPLSFGLQTLPGTYTVRAINSASLCTTLMNGSATVGVNSLPLTYNVTGGGSFCDGGVGLDVGLDGSETGISYYLLLDGVQTGDVLTGTGNVISFGLQTNAGIYTVQAITTATGCEKIMDDQAEIIVLPLPAVPVANNVEVCFDGTEYIASATSDAGTSLVWYADDAGTTIGAPPTGTDPGEYTAWVSATDDVTGCESALVQVTLIINELPAVPVANNVEVCFDNTEHIATATAPLGSSVVWYLNNSGVDVSSAPTATDPGTYEAWAASVDDITGCESDRVLVTLVINPLPDAPVASDLEVCYDGTEYSASATVNVGESLVWYTTETGSVPGLAPTATDPGEYTAWAVAVDDVTGCESERTLVTLIINALPEVTISYGNTVFCPEGSVSVVITTDATIATGIFSANPAGLDIAANGDINLANSASGTYLITYAFTDSNGCANSTSVEISVGEGPSLVDTTPIDAVCAGEASGSISAEATGGILPYTFELLDSDLNILSTLVSETGASVLFEGLLSAVYFVRVTDDNNCGSTLSADIVVDEPDPITIDPVSFIVENISCNGLADGRISLTANGGSGQLSYDLYLDGSQIMGPETGIANFTDLDAGTYYVLISDEAGCSVATDDIFITEPGSILVNATVGVDLVCPSDEATIEVTVSEGTAPYTVTLWFEGAQIDGPLNANEGETVLFTSITDSGTYTVIVADANGCEVSTDVIVSEPIEIMVFNVGTTGDGSYCQDGEGVEILLDGSEIDVSYQMLFEGNPTGDPIEGTGEAISFGLVTQAGNYEVIATHSIAGCELPMAGLVAVSILPLPQVFEVTGGGTICEGEPGVDVTLDGSELGATYSLLLDDVETGLVVAGDGSVLSFGPQAIDGAYTVSAINDITGCTSIMSGSAIIIVNPLPVPVITPTAMDVCEGATVTLTASGGDTYVWSSDPAYDFEGNETLESIEVTLFESTTFYLEATNGCGVASAELTINVVPAPVVDLGDDIAACEGDVVTLDAGEFDDVTYLWSDGSTEQTLEVTENGTYSVTVTSLITSCVSMGEVTVTFNPLPLALVAEDQSICLGSQVFIGVDDTNPVPANTYLWTSDPIDPTLTDPTISNPEVSPLVTTTYTLTETYDATGCANSATVTITVIEITADAGEDQTICGGETVVLGPENVDDELLYSWASSDTGEQFEFDVPNPEVTPFATTTYTLTVEHASLGCVGTASVIITVQPQPLADAGTDQDICVGGEVELGGLPTGPIPANTYLWTSEPEDPTLTDPTISNPTVSPLVTTTYTLTETYVLTGCTNQNSVTVTVHDFPLANVIADRDVCADEVINLGTSEDETGFTYSWTSSPSGFFSNEANPTVIPGLFQLNDQDQIAFTLVVSNGFCTSEGSVVITVYPAPVVSIAEDMTFCSADEAQNQSIGGAAVDGYSYSWSSNPAGFTSGDANPQVSPMQTTTYTLTVTDTQSGCTSTDQVTIVINDLTIVSADNPEICENDSIVDLGGNVVITGGVAPYQYFWSDADGNSISSDPAPVVEAPFSASYNLMVMDQLGCFINATVTIIFTESPEVELFIANMSAGENYAIYPGQTVTFEALPAGYSFYEFYIIDPVIEEPVEEPVDETLKSIFAEGNLVQSGEFNTYTTSELLDGQQVYVIVYDAGCPGYSQKVTITLNELPSAFTPDDDGFNDVFGVGAELTIFNRWGQKVFLGTEGWDGTFNGAKVSPGTYYYLMNVYDQENKRTTVKGSVTVVLQQ